MTAPATTNAIDAEADHHAHPGGHHRRRAGAIHPAAGGPRNEYAGCAGNTEKAGCGRADMVQRRHHRRDYRPEAPITNAQQELDRHRAPHVSVFAK